MMQIEAIYTAWNAFKEHIISIVSIILYINFPIFIIKSIFEKGSLQSSAAIGVRQLMLDGLETFFYVVTGIAIVIFINRTLYGGIVTLADVLKETFSKVMDHFVIAILGMIIVFIGSLLLVVPGIISGMYLTLATFTVVLRNKSRLDALKYCQILITGKWLSVFVFTILLLLGGYVITNLIAECIAMIILIAHAIVGSVGLNIVIESIGSVLIMLCIYFQVIVYLFFFLELEKQKNYEAKV